MKYYSDKTKKLYNAEEDLKDAEKAYDEAHAAEIKEKEEAKADADEIKKAYDEVVAARKRYIKLVEDFTKKHNNYRLTITSRDYFDNVFDNLVDWFRF